MESTKKSLEKAWRFLKLINLSKEIQKPRPVAGFFVCGMMGRFGDSIEFEMNRFYRNQNKIKIKK